MDPSAFSNPAMLAALQSKLNTLIGQSSGYIESLPKVVQQRIAALENLQDQHQEIERQFKEEVLELERKYLEKFRPLYNKRKTIVTGEYEPTEEESKRETPELFDEEKNEEEEEKPTTSAPVDESVKSEFDETTKGIPEFWLTIFKNNEEIFETVTERDEEVLKHLIDIQVSYLNDNPGFKLDFYFKDNEFFTNKVISKTYFLENSVDSGFGDVLYDHAEGTTIEWKEGQDLTVTTETKRQRHKGTNQVRTVVRKVPTESFFNFFSPPELPDDEDEDFDAQEAEEIEMKLEADYGIGEIIKDKLIPDAIGWFTGTSIAYEDDMYDDEELDGEDDDEDDDDEDDDEDDDDEDDPDYQPEAGSQPPECKQQ